MATLKEVKTKIAGVKKTRQITKAMNLVAASKMRGAQFAMDAFRPYAAKFEEVLGSLAEKAGEEASALLVPREEVKKIHIVLCTSDRGLCGGFNANLINKTQNFLKEKSENEVEFSFTNFGRKGLSWARKTGSTIKDEYIGVVGGKIGFNVAINSGRKLIDDFLDGNVDEIHVIYSEFLSMARQTPVMKQLLPIPSFEMAEEEDVEKNTAYQAEHICEPSADELLDEMLPKNVYVQLFNALLETTTSEHAARMMAMDNATVACNDMIESLTLAYNKARQASITAELMDIIGGAEALKG